MALSIVPPREQWHRIDEIRRLHDKSIVRWDPHCNLFFPCVVHGDAEQRLRAALVNVPAFEVEAAFFG